MITERLKAETKPNHDETERITYSKEIMGGDLNLDQYRKIMIKTYIIHKAIEPEFKDHPELAKIKELELGKRMKAHLLAKDLETINLNPEQLAVPENLPVMQTLEDVLGVMYVMEGSSLGGMYIYKALKRNQHLSFIPEFYFYNCYGESTKKYWAEFQKVLLDNITSTEQEDRAIESAKKMFDYYAEIFQS